MTKTKGKTKTMIIQAAQRKEKGDGRGRQIGGDKNNVVIATGIEAEA